MLVDWYPHGHSIVLKLTVHLVHVKAIIEMLFQPQYVLFIFSLFPLLHLILKPPFLLENCKTSLTSEELSDEHIAVFPFKRVENLLVYHE